MADREPLAWLVPSLDVCWQNFAPMPAHRGFIADPPPVETCAEELRRVVEMLGPFLEGNYVLAAHTGTYCRDDFYHEPFLEHYRQALAQGAEVAIHPHEEIRAKGTGHIDAVYMRARLADRLAQLEAGGVRATAYKGGHFSYPAYMTAILDAAGLLADLSAAPDYAEPLCDADWIGAPRHGGYLAFGNPSRSEGALSRVFEIPLGNDGLGSEDINTLYNEKSDLPNLTRVWDAILDRARSEQRPQFVHFLFHNTSIDQPDFLDQFRRLIDHARHHQGVIASPMRARQAFASWQSALG